ncbi:hypothetical protein HMPREF3213_00456 [Heyndrickxia coagulans]|uniref:Uncharacterized protein n=1 Tax=Heyndrickxia coagulans TaxID=1398 RepID=A0A133L084_HEYCO|nr:hypothetical protein HMPREF3213_00456 [Heyndrickxia coagulans]
MKCGGSALTLKRILHHEKRGGFLPRFSIVKLASCFSLQHGRLMN